MITTTNAASPKSTVVQEEAEVGRNSTTNVMTVETEDPVTRAPNMQTTTGAKTRTSWLCARNVVVLVVVLPIIEDILPKAQLLELALLNSYAIIAGNRVKTPDTEAASSLEVPLLVL